MTAALSEAVEQNMIKELKSSPFLGLICDESSDVSNYKKVIIYLTYVNESGIGKTSFIDIIDINDGKAETTLNSTKAVLQNLDIKLCKIVGLGTDGAPVMTGCKGGLGILLKNAGASYLVQTHCSAHRVSLALSQAAKNIPRIKNIELILAQLYHFFYDSPVRESVLREINEINEMPEVKLKEPKNVRWLSLYEAVKAVFKSFGSIVEALELIEQKKNDLNSVKAKGLLTKMKHADFSYLLSVILDVLEPIKKLNLIFQQQNVNFSKIKPMVTSCIEVLEHLKENEGMNEKKYRESCEKNDDGSIIYQNVKIADKISNEAVKSEFISEVIKNLKRRFPETAVDVLNSLDAIFNPFNYPSTKHGQEELKFLIGHNGYIEDGDTIIHGDTLRNDLCISSKSLLISKY